MITSPVRAGPGFPSTVYPITFEPVPLGGATVIQSARLDVFHGHPSAVVRRTMPPPPAAGSVTDVGSMEKVQFEPGVCPRKTLPHP